MREFTLSPDQKGIETSDFPSLVVAREFTLSPDQKGIETEKSVCSQGVIGSH